MRGREGEGERKEGEVRRWRRNQGLTSWCSQSVWKRYKTDDTGMVYYHNEATDETVWEVPEGAEIIDGEGGDPEDERPFGARYDEAIHVLQKAKHYEDSHDVNKAISFYKTAADKFLVLAEAKSEEIGSALTKQVGHYAHQCVESCKMLSRSMEKSQTNLKYVMKEIYMSEKSYYEDLAGYEAIYHSQVKADLESVRPVINRLDEDLVFGELPLILRHSKGFQFNMDECFPTELFDFIVGKGDNAPLSQETICSILEKMEKSMGELHYYSKYVERLAEAQDIVQKWRSDSESGFAAYEKAQEKPLNHYLILPFQRITRYPLLFRRVKEDCLPCLDTKAIHIINSILSKVEAASKIANDTVAKGEDLKRIQVILSSMDVPFDSRCVWQGHMQVLPGELANKDEHHRMSGEHKHSNTRNVYIFSDGMIVLERKGKTPVTLSCVCGIVG
eukprot:746904-Hanusia_phi.AAC.6